MEFYRMPLYCGAVKQGPIKYKLKINFFFDLNILRSYRAI